MSRLTLRFLMIPATILLVTCREEPLEPNVPHDARTAALSAARNGWTVAAPMPTPRFLHTAGAAKDAAGRSILYVFGGTDGEVDGLSTIDAYDLATDTWSTQPFSQGFISHMTTFNGVGSIGNRLYLAGGRNYTGDGHVCIRALQVYDPVRNTWSRKADMPRNSCAGVAGVIDGKLYVLTAIETIDPDCPDCEANTRAVRRLFRYNPVTNVWVTRASCPHFHANAMAGVINGKFYVAGGGSDKLDIYDPATNLWSAGAPLPKPRRQGGAAVLGGKLYVIGGFSDTGLTDEVLAYNPATNRWITKAPLPNGRNFLVAAKVFLAGEPRIVAVGGYTFDPVNETDVYAP